MKGFNVFRKKTPWFSGRNIILIPLLAISSFSMGYALVMVTTAFPAIFPGNLFLAWIEPWILILDHLLLMVFLYWCVYQFWHRREAYLEQHGQAAYQYGFRFALAGMPQVAVIVITSWFPVWNITNLSPVNVRTDILLSSLLPILQNGFPYDMVIRLFAGLVFLLTGLMGLYRSMATFGIDYITSIYTYFPDESEVQEHEIYSALRHPLYLSAILVAVSPLLYHLSLYTLVTAAGFIVLLKLHLTTLEEKELVERFGDSYKEYMHKVPGLMPHIKDIPKLLNYIFDPGK